MKTAIAELVDAYMRSQRERIRWSNRVSAIERNGGEYGWVFEKYTQKFRDMEEDFLNAITDEVENVEIVNRMVAIRGMGKILAAKLYALIDITRAERPSNLWRYAGYAVVEGKAEKPKKGEKLHYNKQLKTICYQIATSFLRLNSPYRRIYDEAKEYYRKNRPDWTKMHIHFAATRKMMKIFLFHLWYVWRKIEGLPVCEPYIIAQDNAPHTMYMPEEFGWES